MEEYNLLGVKINCVSEQIAKELIISCLNSDSQHQIATINPEFIVEAQTNEKFKQVLNNVSFSTIDSAGVIFALQFYGHKVSLSDRLTGVRLTEIILDLASKRNYKILFCLHPQGFTTAAKFFIIIKNKYPELDFQVCTPAEARLKADTFQPEILLAGLGAPLQELWIDEHLTQMPSVKVTVGVGGALDFIAGTKTRAPKFMRSFGLEWLWRLILQPNRIKRIYRAIVVFLYLIITRQRRGKQNKLKK